MTEKEFMKEYFLKYMLKKKRDLGMCNQEETCLWFTQPEGNENMKVILVSLTFV